MNYNCQPNVNVLTDNQIDIRGTKTVVFFACLMAIIAQSGITLYLPSFPDIKNSLNTTNHTISLTLSAYLLGYAIFILLWGNISDYIGRKKTLLIALFLFMITSILIALSTSIKEIIILRFLQGGGGGGCVIVGRIAMRDILHGVRLSKAMSIVSVAFVLSLGVGQFIGGHIATIFNWQYQFILLAVLAAMFFFLLFYFFPETNEITASGKDGRVFLFEGFKTYITIFKKINFLWLTISGSAGYGITIAFNAISPFLLQSEFQLTSIQYGFIGFFISLGYLVGSFFNSCFIIKYNAVTFAFYGLMIIFLSGLCLFLFSLFKPSIYLIIIPVVASSFGQAMVYPNVVTLILNNLRVNIGSSMAFFGFAQQSIGASIALVAAYCPHHTELPMSIMIFIIGSIGFLTFCYVRSSNRREFVVE